MTEFIANWHQYFLNPDRIPETLAAILITMIVGMITGPFMGNANPLLWQVFDMLFGRLGDKMDRPKRPYADIMFRGFILTAFLMIFGAACGEAYKEFSRMFPQFSIAQTLFLATLLTSGTIWYALLKLYFAIEHNKIGKGAFYAIARSTRINLTAGDDYGITRAAISLGVRSFDKGLVAPVLWYIIAGFPGACVYSALAFMAWRFGKNGLGRGFAAVPLALERLMGMIPSILSALYITLGTIFTPTAAIYKSVAAWLGHKNRAPYEQGGYPLSALAWALNISLGGAVQDLNGTALKGEWVGPEGATAQINHKHLRRGLYICVLAHLLFIASLLGMYMWAGIL